MSFKCLLGFHTWDGCKCQKCNKTRKIVEEQHSWTGCLCTKCGASRDTGHTWIEKSCSKCGKEKTLEYAINLFGKNKYKDVIEILESIEQANSKSAYFYFLLGSSYTQYGGQNFNDDYLLLPWIRKSVTALKKSLELEKTYSGLSQSQHQIAYDASLHGERIIEMHSPSLPEEMRRKIYSEYNSLSEKELYNITNLSQGGGGAFDMMNMLTKNISKSKTIAAEKIIVRYNLSKGQMLAIDQEGKEKNW